MNTEIDNTKESCIRCLRRYVGDEIRMARLTKRMTQRDLSAATGITIAAISKIERGESDIKLSTLATISSVLRLSVKINKQPTMNTMKTKEEVISALEREFNSWTAAYVADTNDANASYSTCEISAMLDDLKKYGYEFVDCLKAVESNVDSEDYHYTVNTENGTANVDIDIWGQEFSSEAIENLRKDLKSGNLYVARFFSPEEGSYDILIWK